MAIILMLQWWYGRGWREAAQRAGRTVRSILRTFSVPILISTLFLPWKRVISVGHLSIQERLRAVLDNTISRFVGFSVRLVAIVAAVISIAVFGAGAVIVLVVWPLVPIASLALLVRGVLPW